SVQQGAKVSMVDFNEKALNDASKNILSEFPDAQILTVLGDASNEEDVKKYVHATVEKFGAIHAFYNNAGIEGKQASVIEYDLNVFKKVIDINLMGVYYGVRHVLPIMQKQNYGRI